MSSKTFFTKGDLYVWVKISTLIYITFIIIIDTMIEVALVTIGFAVGFVVTTISHKMGSKSVENIYNHFISPPPNTDYLDKENSNSTSDTDKEPFPFYNFQEYQDYVETNGLEYQKDTEEEEPDNNKFEDLNNG